MQGVKANEWETQTYESVYIGGKPKMGKTSAATSAPTPMVFVACDLGKISFWPGAKRDEILVLPYQDLTREMGDQGTSNPKKDIFVQLMRDLSDIARSIKTGMPIKLGDGTEFPCPVSVVLDGFTRLNSMMVDGKLSLQGKSYTEDLEKQVRFNFWGKRGTDVYTILQQYSSFKKANVIITGWVKAEKRTLPDGSSVETGRWLPDVGGANDLKTAGVVANTLLADFEPTSKDYVLRTKPDSRYDWLGVRDNFTVENPVKVTYKPGEKSPWEKVFGKKVK
jgi:AAA domain-containing protein